MGKRGSQMKLQEVDARLKIPKVGEVGGRWIPDDSERQAAWEMYVELVTRITVVELKPHEGLLREALSSLYSVFGTTREIMRRHGPGTARARDGGVVSFGHLAVIILNQVLRPLLAKWHPELQDYEGRRPPDTSQVDWEREWDRADELRQELAEVQELMTIYAGILGEACGARNLLTFAKHPEQTES